jgi:hypothetical protein
MMKKTSTTLTLLGLISLSTLFIYTGLNLSLIVPIIGLVTIFFYVFLLGILSFLGNYSKNTKVKNVAFILLAISFLVKLIPSMFLILESKLKIEIGLIILSYLLMLSTVFNKNKS